MGKLKSSFSPSRPSNSPPPKILRSSNRIINADARGDDYSSRRQPALVPPTTTTAATSTITSRYSGIKLPHGWGVQEVPRSNPSRVDKYYYEPGTGLKFRSLKAVERYINGEEFTPTPRALRLHNNYCKVSSEELLVPRLFSAFVLLQSHLACFIFISFFGVCGCFWF